MNNNLEKKRMELELIKVSAAKAELEFRIEESLDNINRLKEHIEIQKKKEEELRIKLSQM